MEEWEKERLKDRWAFVNFNPYLISFIMYSKVKAIITGSTGMVGEGVLLKCLHHPAVVIVLTPTI